jgi:hypothetical protein
MAFVNVPEAQATGFLAGTGMMNRERPSSDPNRTQNNPHEGGTISFGPFGKPIDAGFPGRSRRTARVSPGSPAGSGPVSAITPP